jgi:tryptophanyl-tRNA synthetase
MRILSGIQATGKLHIGNYLGMVKPFVEMQDRGEAFYFIPNLHSLNVRPDPEVLRQDTLANVAWFLAAGVDPKKSVVFTQSHVSAHSELCWILNNYVTIGELSRMTAYKDKSAKRGPEGQLVALFTYPVLMAADIILYDAGLVPVGEDQKQHVELTRDIVARFNKLYGDTFVAPKAVLPPVGARIMSLQDPATKMSKSDPNQSGNIMLLDDEATIRSKVKKAVTDTAGVVKADDKGGAVTNLIHIFSGLSGNNTDEIEQLYSGKGYGDFKSDLTDLIVDKIGTLQRTFHALMADEDYLLKVLDDGAIRANEIAQQKLREVKQKLGIL